MLEIQFKNFGNPSNELYVVEKKPIKKLQEDEILIEILLFPINPADLLLVEGKYGNRPALPSKIGAECIARVKEVGGSVKKFIKNDIVLPLSRDNWTEEKIAKEYELIKIDSKIDLLQACMLKVNPATAYLMLNNYVKIKKNDYIIQNAANSGVGSYIIQLCKNYAIKTINIVRRIELKENLKSIGGNHVYNIETIQEKKNFILDCNPKIFVDAVAGQEVNIITNLLSKNSTIINYGLLSGKKIQIDPHNLIFKNISLKGFWLSLWLIKMTMHEKENLYSHLSNLIINKIIFTDVERIFFIKDIKSAAYLAANYNRKGKILVTPSKDIYNKYKNLH